MKTVGHFALLPLLLTLGTARSKGGQGMPEWRSLSNGQDLTGWVKMHAGEFTATNGVLHLAGGGSSLF